jgi:hypothetical protein
MEWMGEMDASEETDSRMAIQELQEEAQSLRSSGRISEIMNI